MSMKCPSEKRCSQCQEHGLPYVSTAAINGRGAAGNLPHHKGSSIASSHSPKLLNPKMSFTCPTCQKISPSASSLRRHRWNLHTPYPSFTAEGKEYDVGQRDGKFVCPFEGCKRLYWRRDTMRKHLKDAHQVFAEDSDSPSPPTKPEGMSHSVTPHMAANNLPRPLRPLPSSEHPGTLHARIAWHCRNTTGWPIASRPPRDSRR